MMHFISRNPFSDEILAEYELMDENKVSSLLEASALAYGKWKNSSFKNRAELLERTALILENKIEHLAKIITLEMGKPLAEARTEIEKCAAVCRYYASQGEGFLMPGRILTEAKESGVFFEPTGCIFAVMPWNFPFWQVFRYAAPCLMAGNVCLLKHAPNVIGCSYELERIFLEAGFDEGVFQSVVIQVELVEQIVSSDIVTGIAFTGSESAGAKVAALAGKYLKKAVMELGGSDPFIVLADADIDNAARFGVISRMINAGQACNGAKRFIVEKPAYAPFLEAVLHELTKIKPGNPLDESVNLGPLARIDLAQNLENQIQRSIEKGAELLFRGPVERCNFSPAVLTGVLPGMAAFDEETFGPLLALTCAENTQFAIKLANQQRYGLAASLWTKNMEKARAIIPTLECGNVFVNSMVRSDPRLPFGGIKKSGFGRELSQYGLHEFVNIKTFYIES